MISWKDHLDDIMELHSEGYSSSEIGNFLEDLHDNREINKPRQIRKVIQANKRPTQPVENYHTAKILVFDIETAPHKAYIWKFWKENVGANQVISDWFCLTWSAKWLFDTKVMSDKLTPQEAKEENDERIIKNIWNLLNEADVVIAHNAINFDIPKLNTRFLQYGMNPPAPYEVIDTLAHLKKRFKFSSNRLNYVNAVLGLDVKVDTGGFDLWARCMEGDSDALQSMEKYNIQDVVILEDLYLKLRPWIKPHPNVSLFIADSITSCPSCGSNHLEPCGTYTTYVNVYEALRCTSCGSISRSRKPMVPNANKNKVVSSPR